MSFVHLHTHTEYSFLDGFCRIPQLVEQAAALGQNAVAITDHGNMCGVIEFYKAARAAGIKPIIGCEVYVAAKNMRDKTLDGGNTTHHLVLLCKNMTGYKNLIKIVSCGFTEGFYYKPRVDFRVLEGHTEGLICLSACLAGEIPQAIMADDSARAEALIEKYKNLFGGENFFLEIQDHDIPEQKKVNAQLIRLAQKFSLGLVATNDIHYIRQQDAKYQDLLMCIQMNRKVSETDRMAFATDQFYLKSEQEMAEKFSGIPEALSNTQKIADMCNVEFEFGVLKLPKYAVPQGYGDSFSYLKMLCEQGLHRRYGENEEARERLLYELNVIQSMGYVDYFLIVWDFINYAKQHGIPVGPGRGSAAGSIVSYALGITNIDPIRFALLFERFLNPERVSMPDIDVDFCNEDRQRVIDYVVEKYGRDCVSQIITFNKMKAKNAIRDVGRVLDVSYAETDAVAKMVPFDLNMTIPLAMKQNPDLKNAYESSLIIRELIDDAVAVEGLIRNAGTHAAGVVISQKPLTEYVPLQKNDDVLITQFPKDTVEELGLLKMDFLGLRNLGIIKDTLRIIKESIGREIDIDAIPLDEPEVYRMISRGETEGVFQLESAGMKQFMKELRPENIEDIIAGISLYRPGPMDQIPRYLKNKNNPQDIVYTHPLLEPILNVTYGCMVYQEQVMEIVRKLAGYSLGRADIVRRAMSKKKMDVMNEERKNFIYGQKDENGNVVIEGALARGVDETSAAAIFDEMIDFAKYAFNKSHAAAYAYVTYQTAYLKCFYPAEYMAALLSSVTDRADKISMYSAEAQRCGIEILPPDINYSLSGFCVTNGKIRFGLTVIKNVGVGVVDAIVAERNKNGNFTSFRDFATRTLSLGVTKRTHEYLIRAGCFDSLGEHRKCLLMDFECITDAIAGDAKQNLEGQVSLFGEDSAEENKMPELCNELPEFDKRELLKLEKESIGYYVSGHPLHEYTEEIKQLSDMTFADLNPVTAEEGEEPTQIALCDGAPVRMCVIVSAVKTKITKNNKIMAFVTVEDLTGSGEMIVFPNVYARVRNMLEEDALLIISGKISLREEEAPKIMCNLCEPLQHVSKKTNSPAQKLYLRFLLGKDFLLDRIKPILQRYRGEVPVYIYVEETNLRAKGQNDLNCDGSAELLAELQSVLGQENVVLRKETVS